MPGGLPLSALPAGWTSWYLLTDPMSGLAGHTGKVKDRSQALGGSGPMPFQRLRTGVANHGAQHEGDHDGVVGVRGPE